MRRNQYFGSNQNRCKGITNLGHQCSRKVINSNYCYQHVKQSKNILNNITENIDINTSKINNETAGLTAEYFICVHSEVKFNSSKKRINTQTYNLMEASIRESLRYLPKIIKHVGHNNEEPDFILDDGATLSVKTNITKSAPKVCPQNIGQVSKNKFISIFAKFYNDVAIKYPSHRKIDDNIKDTIIEYIHKLLAIYLDNTFGCDYLLWIYKGKDMFRYLIISNINKYKFDRIKCSFTRTDNWLESTTIKYEGLSIGEFQIHKHRNCVKFRWIFNNLLKLLFPY